jgi:hypothetical protein
MIELIFLLPTIVCVITIIITWHRRKERNETNREWIKRILE